MTHEARNHNHCSVGSLFMALNSITKLLVLTALAVPVLLGQSCSISTPANNSVISSVWSGMPMNVSLSSAPTAYKVVYSYDGMRVAEGTLKLDPGFVADSYSETAFPFGATWQPAFNGDATHIVSAKLYDIFGTQLADCGSVSVLVNMMGTWGQSVSPLPTSGAASPLGMLTFDGNNLHVPGAAS